MGKETELIHSTAIVHSSARIGEGVEIGPYSVVDEHVSIGSGTKVGSHCVITGHTEIGSDNHIWVGAVIGLEPQDSSYQNEKTYVKIGNRNKIREYVQIHRGTKEGTGTEVGDDNFFLGFSHVAHNCRIGSSTILANGALLGGHVVVEDYAFISGNCLVHQFCRIGKYSMMRGGSRVSLDIPPYCMSDDANALRGINAIGLERRGFSNDRIREIKKAYKELFAPARPLNEQLEILLSRETSQELRYFLDFIKASTRGVCRPQKS